MLFKVIYSAINSLFKIIFENWTYTRFLVVCIGSQCTSSESNLREPTACQLMPIFNRGWRLCHDQTQARFHEQLGMWTKADI